MFLHLVWMVWMKGNALGIANNNLSQQMLILACRSRKRTKSNIKFAFWCASSRYCGNAHTGTHNVAYSERVWFNKCSNRYSVPDIILWSTCLLIKPVLLFFSFFFFNVKCNSLFYTHTVTVQILMPERFTALPLSSNEHICIILHLYRYYNCIPLIWIWRLAVLLSVFRLVTEGVPPDHYTYIFVDEAGQATETECIIPIAGNNQVNIQ